MRMLGQLIVRRWRIVVPTPAVFVARLTDLSDSACHRTWRSVRHNVQSSTRGVRRSRCLSVQALHAVFTRPGVAQVLP